MNGRLLTDAQISRALRAHLPEHADARLRERILDAAETTRQQRARPPIIGALSDADPDVRRRSLLVAAALLIALAFASVAVVGSWRLLQRDPIRDSRLNPPADVTTPVVPPAPSSTAVPISPSPTIAVLAWTPASLQEDWPAPVRAEPAGPPRVVPILCSTVNGAGHYVDPAGDTGSDVLAWADITDVSIPCTTYLGLTLVAERPADVDPKEQWIAYGIVADTDRDGVPDWRYGTDNTPVGTPAPRPWPRRWWRTDLHTGQTEMYLGDNIALPSGTMFYGGPERFSFGGDTTGGGSVNDRPERFYAWASVIQDGRVAATDYAPDVGWFQASPDAKP
jgi:hypothetical protein